MRVRDNLYKQLANKKYPIEKEVTFQHYKRYRNMIVNLLNLVPTEKLKAITRDCMRLYAMR